MSDTEDKKEAVEPHGPGSLVRRAAKRKRARLHDGERKDEDESGSERKCWTAHILTKGNSDSVDVYLPVTKKEAQQLESLEWADFDIWEGDCCGQEQCAVCSGALSAAKLVGIIKRQFSYDQRRNLQNIVVLHRTGD